LTGKKERIDADLTEGMFLETLGLYLLVERCEGRMGKISFSTERPEVSLPSEEKEALLKCWLEGGELPPELLDLSVLSEFRKEVLKFVATIPLGETMTYGEIAKRLGRPKAARAVGQALRANPFPLIIPCHRVVGSEGLGGYSLGVDLKRRLLDVEREICHLDPLWD
jgi:methylated-DNA-[protein]-cysteine S-methyltransferase